MPTNITNVHSDVLKTLLSDSLLLCCPSLHNNNAITLSRHDNIVRNHEDLGHIMLTVSGLDFRAAVFLHFQAGEDAKHVYQLLHTSERSELTKVQWEPFYTELGNHLCGRIKNYFHNDFAYLGMSIPWLMSPTTDLVDLTAPQLTGFSQAFFCLNERPIIGASLYVHSSKPLFFRSAHVETQVQQNTGELEFF